MMINYEALKAAALAIGHERWVQDGSSVNTEDYRIANGEMCCDHIGCFESVNGESPHAKYVSAASPAVVLELLAALEEANKRTEAESVGADKSAVNAVEWMKRANAAEQREDHLKADVAVMGKRIAELEREKTNIAMLCAENVKWMRADHVKEAVRTAGHQVEDE